MSPGAAGAAGPPGCPPRRQSFPPGLHADFLPEGKSAFDFVLGSQDLELMLLPRWVGGAGARVGGRSFPSGGVGSTTWG